MSDYEGAQDPARDHTGGGRAAGGRSLGPTSYLLIGVLVGIILAIVLLWVLRGNPFSSANEVVYTEVVVGSVTESEDQLCWSEDPERRDSQQECAILALDPEIEMPEAGDEVTIGLVQFRTPDGSEFQQVVHVGPPQEGAGSGTSPSPAADDPSPTPTP